MENEKTISAEEFILKRERELNEFKPKFNKWLDEVSREYHCTVIAEMLFEAADKMGGGYVKGYMSALDEIKDHIQSIIDNERKYREEAKDDN